jgi:hypothetical protein
MTYREAAEDTIKRNFKEGPNPGMKDRNTIGIAAVWALLAIEERLGKIEALFAGHEATKP